MSTITLTRREKTRIADAPAALRPFVVMDVYNAAKRRQIWVERLRPYLTLSPTGLRWAVALGLVGVAVWMVI